ncbi:hypothetical protein B0T17DRAFT_57256 [Bombardia bombarda]|uniref:Uncharacterized protein n=1 Tax=Bombardia bombarda TaxID=252184 RepID=A0AA40CFU0_9PEZI|nr:hypothetical protein B0T17DRAFT_57256 [Bombardia bombarda]
MAAITPIPTDATTTIKFDLAIVALIALLTASTRSSARTYFARTMPEWSKLKPEIQSRLAVECGVIPSRLLLFYLTLPLMLHGFDPIAAWTPDDTARSLLSCAILTGSYIVDLTVTRSDKGSTLHHCMGPALLVWIRASFSSFTPHDALLCRLLMQFVFFGATISGATTTTLVFLYQFRKTWFADSKTSSKGYLSFILLLPVLGMSTVVSTFYCTGYIHFWFPELTAHFSGCMYLLPLTWVLVECGMQWRWLLWFYTFEEWYRGNTTVEEGKERIDAVAAGAWWLPRWRFVAIKVLAAVWLGTVAAVVWRTGDLHRLARGAVEMWTGKDGGRDKFEIVNGSSVSHVEL